MKKNKITILLVACVLMLTVYYLNIPSNNLINKPIDNTNDNQYVSDESYYITQKEEIVANRTVMLDQLNLIIGDDASTITEKELALSTMNEITTIQEREMSLEKMIKNIGYEDCLVFANDKVITINVLSDEFSIEEYIEIAVLAKNHFDRSYSVNIQIDEKK